MKKGIKGSYTVEISFIFPMIISVLVIIIYMSFLLHDRAILSSAAYTASLRGSQMISGEDVFSEVEKCSRDLISNRLIGTKNIETDIMIDGDKIAVKYEGTMGIPVGSILCRYLVSESNGELLVSGYGCAKRQDAIGFIRKCRIVERMGEK